MPALILTVALFLPLGTAAVFCRYVPRPPGAEPERNVTSIWSAEVVTLKAQ